MSCETSTSSTEATSHEAVENDLGGSVLSVLEIQPGDPRVDEVLAVLERPRLDDMKVRVGPFIDLTSPRQNQELVECFSLDVDVDVAVLVHGGVEVDGGVASTHDRRCVNGDLGEHPIVDVQVTMLGSRTHTTTERIEIRRLQTSADELVDLPPSRAFPQRTTTCLIEKVLGSAYPGWFEHPTRPDLLSRKLTGLHHRFNPAAREAKPPSGLRDRH
jgi:hypothetical protein